MRYSLRVLSLCAALMFCLPDIARAEPYGEPFQFNRFIHSPGNVIWTTAATGENGDTVVMWIGGNVGNGVYMQRFDYAGRALQSQERLIGPGTPFPQRAVVTTDGTFAIASNEPDGSGVGVYVTVYDRPGNILVRRFRVNDRTDGDQAVTSMAINPRGQFIVTYSGTSPTTGLPAVYSKFYELNGFALNREILIHSATSIDDRIGSVDSSVDGLGNVVISWSSGEFSSVQFTDVYARRYNWSGAPLGNTFQVNSNVSGSQDSNRIAMNSDGTFMIAWISGGRSITGRRYDAAGNPLGNEFPINAQRDFVYGLDINSTPNGGFVVAWVNPSQIFVQEYSANGMALEAVAQVSQTTSGSQVLSQVGVDRDGNLFIGWLEHAHSATAPVRLWARRYAPSGLVIQPLSNGQVASPLDGATDSWRFFKLVVPQGHTILDVATFGGAGDADLYIRYGALPTLSSWDVRPFRDGNDESVRITNIPPGVWYIGIQGFAAYNGLGLQASSL